MFIVIEGDNGSGKTTISKILEKKGYHNVSADEDIKKIEQISKEYHPNSIEKNGGLISIFLPRLLFARIGARVPSQGGGHGFSGRKT